MKLNPKKLSFFTLTILFAAHIMLCLFVGVTFASAIGVDSLVCAAVLFIVSHIALLFKGREQAQSLLYDVTITDTTYAGEFYSVFLSKMIMGFESMTKGLIKVHTGIKKKMTIGVLDAAAFIQAPQDPPVFGGTATLGGRVIVPDDIMGYMEINPALFEAHWLAVQMNPALLDRALPVTFESACVDRIMKLNQQWMDRIFWQGVKDGAAITTAKASGLAAGDNNLIFTDGIIKIANTALTAGNKILTAGGAVAFTAANIQAQFAALKALIMANSDGAAAYNDQDFVFIANYKTGQLLGDAIKAQTYKGDDFTGKGLRQYDGRRVVEVPGMPDNTIFAGICTNDERSQLRLGCNAADEETKFRVARKQANSELMFIKMLAKFAFQISVPEQAFLYTTTY